MFKARKPAQIDRPSVGDRRRNLSNGPLELISALKQTDKRGSRLCC